MTASHALVRANEGAETNRGKQLKGMGEATARVWIEILRINPIDSMI